MNPICMLCNKDMPPIVKYKNICRTCEDKTETICGCTKAAIFGGDNNPCWTCGHANRHHNFGKGCRIVYDGKGYYVVSRKDIDYTQFKRLMK